MAPNIDPWVTNLTDLQNGTFHKPIEWWSSVMPSDTFFTIIFAVIGIAIYMGSNKNPLILTAYLLAVDVFCAILIMPIALGIFGIITALLIGVILYRGILNRNA